MVLDARRVFVVVCVAEDWRFAGLGALSAMVVGGKAMVTIDGVGNVVRKDSESKYCERVEEGDYKKNILRYALRVDRSHHRG